MKSAFLLLVCFTALCFAAGDAGAVKNQNGKWALHYAGEHDAKAHTCAFRLLGCSDLDVYGRTGAGRDDIYVIAIDVDGIAGTRYGICCEGPVYFYGWTKCCDLEIPTAGWPGCGEGNAQTWAVEQLGPFVTIGILDVYLYATTQRIGTCADPREDFAEWCDGSQPSPICHKVQASETLHFGWVGFNGNYGYAPCGGPTESSTWGAVKSLYR